jgi:sugar lactone lactonase YvrE
MKRSYVLWLMVCAACLLMITPIAAQDGPPPMPELDGEIVMGGLNGPQGLYIDAEGNLWVVDSGVGGDEEVEFFNVHVLEPAPGTFGNTARIIRMSPDGEQDVVALLPSIAVPHPDGLDFIGGARVAELDGVVYATVGAWHFSIGDDVTLPLQAQVVRIEDGAGVTVADLWAHELEHNPDGDDNRESHPFGITAGPDGLLYVADAAANALISVDPASGETATVAGFDGLPGVFPNRFRSGELITDSVPTAVVFDAEGDMYVSFLSGAPFIPGSAKVVHVTADGEVSDFATGFTMLVDLTLGPDGNFYAVQFGMFTEEGPVFNSGSVVRIYPDGSSELLIEGLPFATAIALDVDGNGYVAINGVAIPDAGMVVYYEGLADMQGQPMTTAPGDQQVEAELVAAMSEDGLFTIAVPENWHMGFPEGATDFIYIASSEALADRFMDTPMEEDYYLPGDAFMVIAFLPREFLAAELLMSDGIILDDLSLADMTDLFGSMFLSPLGYGGAETAGIQAEFSAVEIIELGDGWDAGIIRMREAQFQQGESLLVAYERDGYVVLNLTGAHLDEIREELWLAMMTSFEINITAEEMMAQLEAMMSAGGE